VGNDRNREQGTGDGGSKKRNRNGLGLGVSLRCAPGRAARAVGNDTTVANRAGPPPRHGSPLTLERQRTRGAVPALRARIPHASMLQAEISAPDARARHASPLIWKGVRQERGSRGSRSLGYAERVGLRGCFDDGSS
jgi:hypothetical protein